MSKKKQKTCRFSVLVSCECFIQMPNLTEVLRLTLPLPFNMPLIEDISNFHTVSVVMVSILRRQKPSNMPKKHGCITSVHILFCFSSLFRFCCQSICIKCACASSIQYYRSMMTNHPSDKYSLYTSHTHQEIILKQLHFEYGQKCISHYINVYNPCGSGEESRHTD